MKTVAGAFLLQMCAVGPVCGTHWIFQYNELILFLQVTSFGVFQAFYTTSFLQSFSASDISWIGSVQLFLELSLGFVGGKLYEF